MDQYIGEIRMFSYRYQKEKFVDWLPCEGQLLNVTEHQALFGLLGNTFGGDGITTFGIPDLRGRVVRGFSETYHFGSHFGQEKVALNLENMPRHNHLVRACNVNGDRITPENSFFGIANELEVERLMYTGTNLPISIHPDTVAFSGEGHSHNNLQPFIALQFCIACNGDYPNDGLKDEGVHMSKADVGEIRMFGGNFAPANWMLCEGQVLSISDHMELYAEIGITYGGDGVTTFALPDMRGRVPLNIGKGEGESHFYNLGDRGGEERVELKVDELPKHKHDFRADTSKATESTPEGEKLSSLEDFNLYLKQSPQVKVVAMADKSLSECGQSESHKNVQPSLCINFIICVKETTLASNHYIGEIRIFSFAESKTPRGWKACDGSLLEISEATALYSIIGNYYGGDGRVTVQLPDMRDRIPMHKKENSYVGHREGIDAIVLTMEQMPAHRHKLMAIDELADTHDGGSEYMLARANRTESRNLRVFCTTGDNLVNFKEDTVTYVGGAKADVVSHTNIQPSFALRYCIAVEGDYPPRE